MRLSSALLSFFALSSLLNSGCGKWAKASPETVNTMDRPEFPVVENDVFSLNSSKKYISYKGTLFIANPAATPTDFAELIDASIESRVRWAELAKFEIDTKYNATYGASTALAKNQLKLMKDGLQSFELEALGKTPIAAADKLAHAETWIEREIAGLNLTAEQKASFDASWGHYCEAKIIEFAAHPLLSQNSFKTQPSPAPLCQKYYAEHQLMTSPDCASDTGDYLKCIWLDGVAKTRWFTSPNEATNADLARAKEEKRTQLVELFSDTNYQATKDVLGYVEAAFSTSAAYKKLYFDKKDAMLNIAVKQTNDTRCLKAIVNVGSQALCTIFGLSTEQVSPKQIIDAMEGVVPSSAIMTDLAAPADRSYTTQQAIQFINRRNTVENSEGDRLFLDVQGNSTLSNPDFSKYGGTMAELIPGIRASLGAEFYGSFSDADLSLRQTKLDAIQSQQALIDFYNAEYTSLFTSASAGSDRGAEAANRPGFGVGFLNYELILQQADNVLSVELAFEDQEIYSFRTCMDLSSRVNVECPASFQLRSGRTYLPAQVSWAQDGGMMQLSLPLNNVTEIGFGPKARHPETEKATFFMDLPPEETEGKTLRFELYRNRILERLDIMTGKAFIEDTSHQYYEGAVSIWENVD